MEREERTQERSENMNYRTGIRSGVFGLVCNALLFAAKLTVGVLIRSISVTADAFNNLLDGASSAITVAGYKLAARPADREHPYGHQRFEYIAALVVAVLMFVIGALFLKESITSIFSEADPLEVKAYAYVVLGVSVAVKGAQAAVYGFSYRKTRSLPMKAAMWDSLGDMLATSTAILSAVIWDAAGTDLDGYFGAAISLFILFTAFRLLKDSVSPLLGAAPLASLVGTLKGEIASYDGVLGVHDLVIHSYGASRIYAVAHVEVAATMDLVEAHDLIDKIEREVGRKLGVELVAHVDPRDEKETALEEQIRALLSDAFPTLSVHDFRLTEEGERPRVCFDAEIPYESPITADEILPLLRSFAPEYEYVVNVDRK